MCEASDFFFNILLSSLPTSVLVLVIDCMAVYMVNIQSATKFLPALFVLVISPSVCEVVTHGDFYLVSLMIQSRFS